VRTSPPVHPSCSAPRAARPPPRRLRPGRRPERGRHRQRRGHPHRRGRGALRRDRGEPAVRRAARGGRGRQLASRCRPGSSATSSSPISSQGASELGVEVTDEEVAERREELIEEVGGQEPSTTSSSESGLTDEQIDEQIREHRPARAVQEELTADVEVTDEDVEAFYEENREPATSAPRRGTSSSRPRRRPTDILERLEDGEDFADVAEEESIDTGSAAQGGELGEFGRGQMVPEFEEAVFTAEIGEVVGPVETQFGFHIIEVTERNSEELEDVEDEIRDELVPAAAGRGRPGPGSPSSAARPRSRSTRASASGTPSAARSSPPIRSGTPPPLRAPDGDQEMELEPSRALDPWPPRPDRHRRRAARAPAPARLVGAHVQRARARGAAEHPFVPHLDAAELRTRSCPDDAPVSADPHRPPRRAEPRAQGAGGVGRRPGRSEHGEVAYLFGPGDTEAFTRTSAWRRHAPGSRSRSCTSASRRRARRCSSSSRSRSGCAARRLPVGSRAGPRTLARYAVEEVYELLEAITSGDPDAIREELGDVLLQVVFHAQIAEDAGTFDIDDVAKGIARSSSAATRTCSPTPIAEDADEVMANWEELKAAEKPERDGPSTASRRPAGPALRGEAPGPRRQAPGSTGPTAEAAKTRSGRAELEELLGRTRTPRSGTPSSASCCWRSSAWRGARLDPELALRGAAAPLPSRRRGPRPASEGVTAGELPGGATVARQAPAARVCHIERFSVAGVVRAVLITVTSASQLGV
jgi:NTP pyrophosphatase (non-canonical NTP hydrolase)